MTQISMTTFIKFISTTGMSKVEIVEKAKENYNKKYDPKTDFYKRIRDAIKKYEREQLPKAFLTDFLKDQSTRKQTNYAERLDGYKKWRKKHQITYFSPSTAHWNHGGLSISVTPELGLNINGVPHLIRIYFDKPPLAKKRIDVALQLMNLACKNKAPSGCAMGILDVRNSRLFTQSGTQNRLQILLRGEAVNFLSMWNDL